MVSNSVALWCENLHCFAVKDKIWSLLIFLIKNVLNFHFRRLIYDKIAEFVFYNPIVVQVFFFM